MLFKCLGLGYCQGTVIETHYSHETTTTAKQPFDVISSQFSAINASVSAQNKYLDMSNTDTVKALP